MAPHVGFMVRMVALAITVMGATNTNTYTNVLYV